MARRRKSTFRRNRKTTSGLFSARQWHRHRGRALGKNLCSVQTAPRKGHPWQRHRPCDLPENRGALWGEDLGGIGIWKGIDFPLYFSGGQASQRMRTRHIVLIEDNPGDVLLVQ